MDGHQVENGMKSGTKFGIVLLVIGLALALAGSFMKMLHWPGGKHSLVAGLCLVAVAIIMIIIATVNRKN